MAYFYNGVKLPELPSDVLADYPYCWIRKNDNTEHYDLVFTKIPGYYDATAGGIVYGANEGTAEIVHYRVPYASADSAENWDNYQTTNTWMALDANRTIMWSNHYIPNGSLTATEMYFNGSEAIPDEGVYQIQKDTLVGFADQVRRLCNTENTMTPAEMESNLNDLNIELEEAYVTPTSEPQEILPGPGFYGFSKIYVDAAPENGGTGGGTGGDSGGDTGGGDSGGDSGGGGDSSDLTPAEDETFGHETYPYMAYYHPDGGFIDYAPAPIGKYCAIYWVTNNLNGPYGGPVIAHYAELWVSQYPLEHRDYGLWPVKELEQDGWLMSKYVCDMFNGETAWTHEKDIHICIENYDWVNHDIADSPGSAGTYGPYVWKVETEETYTIEGETVNALVSAAQTVTNSLDPLTPDEATAALEEYAADKWEGGSY